MQGADFGRGSMSTVSRDDNMVMSSEDSSSPDEGEIELGLELSLGGFKGQRYGRILTAQDLPSASNSNSTSVSSTSSSSSTLSRANVATVGTKRTADSVAASNAAASQVVGWPPIRAYRMNSMVNQAKSMATEEFSSMIDKNGGKNTVGEKTMNGNNVANGNANARVSLFVKVNMDGIPIGRKVDLSAHRCYENLAQTLEDMFLKPTPTINSKRSSALEPNQTVEARRSKLLSGSSDFVLTYEDKEGDWMLVGDVPWGRSKLLSGSSDFVLTYEDKEGDWMLVGDVPWGMFLGSVKRLRIMRTSESTWAQNHKDIRVNLACTKGSR